MSDSSQPHGLQPTRLLRPWDFQAKILEWGAIAFSQEDAQASSNLSAINTLAHQEETSLTGNKVNAL